ncbi:MAG TPA: RhuM family protein [Marinilabiliaceae bacterium]|nr:RhuM family protein [Marinilabiliaceae bacterium]
MDSEIIIYQAEDGQTKIQTRLEDETVWLTQDQMAELFQRERSVITKHVGNIFREGELDEKSNVQNLHISGSDKPVKFYNLNVIISVGYRVKSHRGTQFRIWATQRLKETRGGDQFVVVDTLHGTYLPQHITMDPWVTENLSKKSNQ